ncbi:hypothetical protein OSB04_011186 [Centaurea solstitialis]|uniref:Reverse transcriptase domain-containing protein n=1 Tax=Centaurea solstitialis TaxID=347529 RepID=A0AA38TS11_9ASTR|nr:hypothetical protein OSB04_011186 [Centaurea solstitialis]
MIAFLKGRSILYGVLVANEMVLYLKSAKRKGMIFKVDFEKAYDSVNWNFLLEVLENMGFGIKWRKWIATCLKTSRISILVNGSPTDEFPMQGGPLAPFLFLVVAEGLHIKVEEAIEKGIFKGLKVENGDVSLSIFQYADDVVTFGKWGAENIVNLVKLFRCFYEVSGLKVNLNKCNIFGIGVPEEKVRVGCGSGSLQFVYLGLPVGVSMKRISHWENVVTKLKNKFSNWKAKWLSFGGRLSWVKSVLSSLPLYYFSLFLTPVSVIKISFGGRCLGGSKEPKRGRAWVKWEKVLDAFEWGGLNIGGLGEMNWSLIGKDALWREVIQSIYGESSGLEWGVGHEKWRSSMWRSVINLGRAIDGVGCNFSGSFGKVVGNGCNTKYWEDRWAGGVVLKERFRRLYNLETCKEVLVADRGSFVGDVWGWTWSWRRPPLEREESELLEMSRLIENFKPVPHREDKVDWMLDPVGGYSVKVFRTVLSEKRSERRVEDRRGDPTKWVKEIPSKINVFYWRANLERVPCRVLFDKYGIYLDSTLCPRCNSEVESVPHALFSCKKVKNLWSLVGEMVESRCLIHRLSRGGYGISGSKRS